MKKMRTICVTALLALALCSPAYAGDGQIGMGKTGQIDMGGTSPQAIEITPTDEAVVPCEDSYELLQAAKLAFWLGILTQF